MRQLRLLLWKNFKLKSRSKKTLAAEIILPVFLFLILAMVRFSIKSEDVDAEIFDEFPVSAIPVANRSAVDTEQVEEELVGGALAAILFSEGLMYSSSTNPFANAVIATLERIILQNVSLTIASDNGTLVINNINTTVGSAGDLSVDVTNSTVSFNATDGGLNSNQTGTVFQNGTVVLDGEQVAEGGNFTVNGTVITSSNFGDVPLSSIQVGDQTLLEVITENNITVPNASNDNFTNATTLAEAGFLANNSNFQVDLSNVTNGTVNLGGLFTPMVSEDAIVEKYLDDPDQTYMGIVFKTGANDSITSYKIRMSQGYLPSTRRVKSRIPFPGPNPDTRYYYSGFILMQHYVDRAIIETRSKVPVTDGVVMSEYPYPAYTKDRFSRSIARSFPLFMTFSWIYSVAMIAKEIVHEKEVRLKEAMRIMGLVNWIHAAGWFVTSFLIMSISVVLLTLIMIGGQIVQYASPLAIFFFLLLFALTTVTFAFLISVFFSKSKLAAAAGGILYFLTYLPYMFIAQSPDDYTPQQKVFTMLLSPSAFGFGADIIAKWEESKDGLQFQNFNKFPSVDDDLKFSTVVGMMIFDLFLYSFMAWYIERVFPGEFGVPLKFYFPLSPSYWKGTSKTERHMMEGLKGHHSKRLNCEPDPEGLATGISIRNLSKVYTTNRQVALNNLSLNMYEDQITAYLGHNGAGKTTTMSILCGLYTPTSGTAYVNGMDIATDMDEIRKNVGICPQYNVLFDRLTVEEHLRFYASVKGVDSSMIREEIDTLIEDVGLTAKRDSQASCLSGGMKRKLSVAIAFVGGSKIVILDEPTAGMDPYARRATWELLLKHKKGRCIMLSTHFMDEADILGDRIAIVREGELVCSGSPIFLKRYYGCGYHLSFSKAGHGFDLDLLTKCIKSHVPKAFVAGNLGSEVTFILPSDTVSAFPELFAHLEQSSAKFGFESYGISVTTLEEVFLRVADKHAEEEEEEEDLSLKQKGEEIGLDVNNGSEGIDPVMKNKEIMWDTGISKGGDGFLSKQIHDSFASTRKSAIEIEDLEKQQVATAVQELESQSLFSDTNEGKQLKYAQFFAMFAKRYHHCKRDIKGLFFQLLLPGIFVSIAMLVAIANPLPGDPPERDLTLIMFGTPHYILSMDSDISPNGQVLQSIIVRNDFQAEDMVVVPPGQNMSAFILDNYYQYEMTSFASYWMKNEYTIAYYKNDGRHSWPSSLNRIDNVLMQKYMGDTEYRIQTSNHPFPQTEDEVEKALRKQGTTFVIGLCMIIALSFIPASFTLFVVQERVSKSKHLQFVSGLNTTIYWCSAFAWDVLNYMLPFAVLLTIIIAFNVTAYTGENLPATMLLLLLYVWGTTPLMYIAQRFFEFPSTAYVALVVGNIFFGATTSLATFILDLFPDDPEMVSTNDILKKVFLIFPNYCMGRGLMDLSRRDLEREVNDTLGRDGSRKNALEWDIVGVNIFCMVIEGFVYFGILLLIEHDVFNGVWRKAVSLSPWDKSFLYKNSLPPHEDEDSDVQQERWRVENGEKDNGILVLKKLSKVYDHDLVAVRNLSVSIEGHECFGLLGVNGAGKTTTFEMLTGDHFPSSGNATVNGYSILTNIRDVRKHMGYCPQFDALVDKMTVTEMLFLYARLRGIKELYIPIMVDWLIQKLQLGRHAHKVTMDLSGGNKRKLSTAIALIGNPSILFLDEPTTGMDPKARRFLWSVVSNIRESGRCVVLTSHSMEECEALCTRIGIMVNGQLKCLGGVQHLKSKYGNGFTVIIKLSKDRSNCDIIEERMNSSFAGCWLRESHSVIMHFQIEDPNLLLSSLFKQMELLKAEFEFEDYSVCQTSLDQIFINFASKQGSVSQRLEDILNEKRASDDSCPTTADLGSFASNSGDCVLPVEENGVDTLTPVEANIHKTDEDEDEEDIERMTSPTYEHNPSPVLPPGSLPSNTHLQNI
eukprot:Nk52_evm42s236 gene=Nk52_evmTU42s236